MIGKNGPKRFVLHGWAKSVTYPVLKAQLKDVIARFPFYSAILIEDKANGSALISELGDTHRCVIPINPEGGKVSRANAIVPAVEAGDVYLPRNAPWREDFVQEHAAFPTGRYDDYVDAVTQAIAYLRESSAHERNMAMAQM